MTIDDLLDALAAVGADLGLEGDRLRLRAPAGALSSGLRAEVTARKLELIERLRAHRTPGAAEPQPPSPAVESTAGASPAAADDPHAPFPLTEIQQAYWIGRSALDAEGLISTYAYFEMDLDALDVERLRAALARLRVRHPMLRAVVDPDGRQRVLADAAPRRCRCSTSRPTPTRFGTTPWSRSGTRCPTRYCRQRPARCMTCASLACPGDVIASASASTC